MTGLKATVTAREAPGVRFQPLVFIAFTLLAVMTNYPGRLNEDSLGQLIGAANPLFLTDHHSPTVTWLWSLRLHSSVNLRPLGLKRCRPYRASLSRNPRYVFLELVDVQAA